MIPFTFLAVLQMLKPLVVPAPHPLESSDTVFDDLWRLDLATFTWQSVTASGPPPPPRGSCSMHTLLDRFILIWGGYDGARCLDDLCLLDLNTLTWSKPGYLAV